MRFTFVQTAEFTSSWKRLRLTDEDLQALESLIAKRPESGAIMVGTGGLRKIRFAPPSRHSGKSGATRACYVYVMDACALVTIFAKNEKSNLSAKERAAMAKAVKVIRQSLERKDDSNG